MSITLVFCFAAHCFLAAFQLASAFVFEDMFYARIPVLIVCAWCGSTLLHLICFEHRWNRLTRVFYTHKKAFEELKDRLDLADPNAIGLASFHFDQAEAAWFEIDARYKTLHPWRFQLY